jgi:hypothetical protein
LTCCRNISGVLSVLEEGLPAWDERHIRKQGFSKPNNFRILGLSLSGGGLDSCKIVLPFPQACSHPSTILRASMAIRITPLASSACHVLWSAYEETNPQLRSIITKDPWTYPRTRRCEQKAGLSLTPTRKALFYR